jgi:hypothetical protein
MLPVRITHPFQDCGLFAAERKHDVHTGLDLYCEEGEHVRCLAKGLVINIFTFTGEEVGTPWWNTTEAIVVDCGDLIYVYGEVIHTVEIGQTVNVGDTLGLVTPVLKVNKGITPTSMLHLEVWQKFWYIENFTWNKGYDKPNGLLNPLSVLQHNTTNLWLIKTQCGYMLEDNSGKYLIYFKMAADSKSYLDREEDYVYLTEQSKLEDKIAYTLATGKALWFDLKGENYGYKE